MLKSEIKIDSSFPPAQFHIDGYIVHRCDRDENGSGLLYVREDIPSTLLKTDSEVEAFYVELIYAKKEMVIIFFIQSKKSYLMKHLAETGRNQDLFSSKYDNLILDFNSEPCEQPMRDFFHVYNCENIIKDKTCFKNPHNPSCIGLFITGQKGFKILWWKIETGLISTKYY